MLIKNRIISPDSVIAESNTYEKTISAGNHTFDRLCSVCHGNDAKGNSLFADNLKISPPALTKLTSNNDGNFPWIKMYQIIDSNDFLIGHGTREMPIWGEIFDLNSWCQSYSEHSISIKRWQDIRVISLPEFYSRKLI